MNITVYLGSRSGNRSCYADYAYALGAWIARHGHTLVYGGSRTGLMGNWLTVLCRPEARSSAWNRSSSWMRNYSMKA